MTGVTDAYGKGPEHADRMRETTKLIVSMLRTWSGSFLVSRCARPTYVLAGLMYFSAHDKLALRTLVDGLRIPSLTPRVSDQRYTSQMNVTHTESRISFSTCSSTCSISSLQSGTRLFSTEDVSLVRYLHNLIWPRALMCFSIPEKSCKWSKNGGRTSKQARYTETDGSICCSTHTGICRRWFNGRESLPWTTSVLY